MRRDRRGFHILDKDLDRITHTETAQAYAFRPILRLGLVMLVFVAGLIVAMGLIGGDPGHVGIWAGLLVALWLGLAIGANDVANSLGPAVGAGAIGMLPGLVIVALAEVAGASLAGGAVTHRLAGGIFDAGLMTSAGQEQILMLGALVGAAIWITLATAAGLPVSTSHSIVGAIAGSSMAALGLMSVNWTTLMTIASAWVLSPILAGALAAAFLALVVIRVGEAPDRATAARYWVPLMVGAMVGLFLAYLSLLATRRLGVPAGPWVIGALLTALPAGWAMRRRLWADFPDDNVRPRMKHLFRPPLLAAVVIMAFAHGANDVGNIAGPLSVILPGKSAMSALQVPLLILLAAGVAIALGTLLFGGRLVDMVGSGITRLKSGQGVLRLVGYGNNGAGRLGRGVAGLDHACRGRRHLWRRFCARMAGPPAGLATQAVAGRGNPPPPADPPQSCCHDQRRLAGDGSRHRYVGGAGISADIAGNRRLRADQTMTGCSVCTPRSKTRL